MVLGVPFSWVSSVAAYDILPFPFCDHCAVCLSVSVPDVIASEPGLGKLNLSVLHDPEYVSLITGFWSFWRTRIFVFLLWTFGGTRGSVKLGVCTWTIARGVQLLRE